MRNMSGVIVVVPTPFDTEGRVDDASLERLIGHYLSLGVHGLTIMGVMGEGAKLTATESDALMQRIFSFVGGQVPVIVGASNPDDSACRAIAEQAMALGAAGVMIAPKRGLEGDAAVFDYFVGLCSSLGPDVPVCVQDYPPVSGVVMSVEGLVRLFRDLPQLAMLKLEDMPGLDKLTRLLRQLPNEPAHRPAIFVGNNALFTELELARGADGIMTGFAFPEMLLQVYERHRAGDLESAADIYEMYLPLIRYEMQPVVGLAARKYVLQRQGHLACADLRTPGYTLTPEDRSEIDRMLARLERRRGAA
jgi:4-hydroxy-tetrahydrodipicolinate synthase